MEKKKSKGSGYYVILGILALFVLSFGGCFAIRSVGRGTYQGTVQRAYEKATEYRVEFVTTDGDAMVFTNAEATFPYWKTNTANLQAELNQAAKNGDEVEIVVYGWRSSLASSFPNVIDLEVKVSDATAKRREKIDALLDEFSHEKITKDELLEKLLEIK